MTIPESTPRNGHDSQTNSILMRWVSELEQRSRESNAVLELNSQLNSASSTVEAYDVAANALERLFPGWTGYIGGCDWENQTVLIQSYWGREKPQETIFSIADCQALSSGDPHIFKLSDSPEPCQHFEYSPPASQQICQPISSHGQVYGLIALQLIMPKPGEPNLTSPAITESRQNLLEMIADQLGLALREISARRKSAYPSRTNRLANLNNRMYLEELLIRELQNARLTNTPLSLLFFRLDTENSNDLIFEAQSGNLLKKVGALLASNIRKEDSAALAGSDMFVVILKNTSSEQAMRVAGRVTNLIAVLPTEGDNMTLAPPPIGLVVFNGDISEEVNPLEKAEAAYEAAQEEGPGKIHLAVY
jgi:diguanylate cyclase (GGDEF)-like protein